MLYRNITFPRFAVIAAVASMVYSGNSPVTLAQQPVPGSYELSFFIEGPGGLEPVSCQVYPFARHFLAYATN